MKPDYNAVAASCLVVVIGFAFYYIGSEGTGDLLVFLGVIGLLNKALS